LRKHKLNQLPHLCNILKRDMSLVGWLPLMPKSFSYYPQHVQDQITRMKPGLSGVGSIIFRDEESIVARANKSPQQVYTEDIAPYKGEVELWYQRHQNLSLDLKIIFVTTLAVLLPQSREYEKLLSDLPPRPSAIPPFESVAHDLRHHPPRQPPGVRILIINQAFWPDIVATAQLMADWSEDLTARGHEVSIIASRSIYGRQGAILPERDRYKGAKIYRVGANLFKKGRILTRLIDFGLFHVLALRRAMALPRQDVVVCLTTPPFIGIVGLITKKLRGSRYVQYEMDLYPDVPVALGALKPGSPVTQLFERVHRTLLRTADRVIVLGRCMERVIKSKGIPASKLVLVTPWADPDEIAPVPRETNPFRIEHHLSDKFVIMYGGNLGLGHDISTVTAAMRILNDSMDPIDRKCCFVFMGGGQRMRELQQLATENNLTNVLFLDYQPREKLAESLSAADVHLITQAHGTSGLIVPTKFYGMLASGRPGLYVGPSDSEAALVLRETGLGAVLEIGDVQGFLAAIRRLRDFPDPTQESLARATLRNAYSRQVCTQHLSETVESLVPEHLDTSDSNPRDSATVNLSHLSRDNLALKCR
jgi:glycosyltransferase involved in cell wall biosynthesis